MQAETEHEPSTTRANTSLRSRDAGLTQQSLAHMLFRMQGRRADERELLGWPQPYGPIVVAGPRRCEGPTVPHRGFR